MTISLRHFDDADVGALLEAFADDELWRWNPGPIDADGVAEWMRYRNDWSDGQHASWAIDLDGVVVGSVSLHHVDHDQRDAEVGYWVAASARRRGVATRGLELATAYGFDELGLHRVYLYHAVDNAPSCGVAGRAGYLLEGTLRQSHRYGDGEYHDEHLHARLGTD
jgi:RimJ/RimL family protein N-acetyltransferase